MRWLVALGLVAAALAVFVVRNVPPPPSPEPATPPPTTADEPERAEQAAPAGTPAAQPAPPSDLPHTSLPLRLLATVVHRDRAKSIATVLHVDRAAHQVLGEGEALRGHPRASVVSIEAARLVLDNDGVREQLVVDWSTRGPQGPVARYEPTPEEREYRQNLARRLRAITDAGEDYLGRGKRGGILLDGDVSAVYEEGELVGVRFEDLREGGVYEQIGIREGDVVRSINGVSMGAPTAAAEVLTDLALEDQLEVEVERADGVDEVLTVATERLTNLLAEFDNPQAQGAPPIPPDALPEEIRPTAP